MFRQVFRIGARVAFCAPVPTSQALLHSSSARTAVCVSRAVFPSSFAGIGQPRSYASSAPIVLKVPPMGDSITEGTIQKWMKAPGDSVQADELVAQVETDKVVVDIRAPTSGTIAGILANEGDTVLVGADLYTITPGAVASSAKPAAAPKPTEATSTKEKEVAPPKEAPKPAVAEPVRATAVAPASKPSPAPAAKPSLASPGERVEHRERMPKIRVRIAKRLKEAQNTYAMLTTFQEVDMSALMSLRAQFKDEFEKKHGVKLGFMSTFVKASVTALAEQPIINAVIDAEKDEIIHRSYYDISVAVAGPSGLVVPVLRDCGGKTFSQIEKEIAGFGKKARDGTLTIDEMTGGTFTISNGGVYGSLFGTPILNPPQSAILGMHAINKRPVVVNDQVVIRPMMYLALTYDHRIIDGKDAVTFLRRIKEIVEDPVRLLLD
eukprot:TRINITY_DN12639_c0_g1_i1.p1 TRINITY_DN12639_c0_g1~~TRINITY_DN12639_c0_g1_i1.p1  ORF type:complete len:436 (-),score=30.22 TRINITY_DN12639_c0_g1_i1:83-1390(-)